MGSLEGSGAGEVLDTAGEKQFQTTGTWDFGGE